MLQSSGGPTRPCQTQYPLPAPGVAQLNCGHGTPKSGLRTCLTSIRQGTWAPGQTAEVRSWGAQSPRSPGCLH